MDIVDANGNPVNRQDYDSVLAVPQERQDEISAMLRTLETKVTRDFVFGNNELTVRQELNPLLRNVDYSRYLLDTPYTLSENSVQILTEFYSGLYSEDGFSVEAMVENTQKITRWLRTGIAIHLSDSFKEAVLEQEEAAWHKGNKHTVIKLMGRYPVLGISSHLTDSRKDDLERTLTRYMNMVSKDFDKGALTYHFAKTHSSGLMCSAKRAGLELPAIRKGVLDFIIQKGLEQPEGKLSLDRYIADMSHIRELLVYE